METSSIIVLALAWLAAVVFTILSSLVNKQKPKLPPGPKPWPIIGNLNLLGSIPHQSLHSLSQKYGEIMLLRFGCYLVIVASSPRMAELFLKTHDSVFASRPTLASGKYTSYNFSDMIWAPYSPYWRQARKIYLTEMFSPKKLDSYENVRVEERHNFISNLYDLRGKPVILRGHLFRYALKMISRIVYSYKYYSEEHEHDDEHGSSIVTIDELKEMLDEWFLLNGVINVGGWIPWLSFFDVQGYVKRMKDLYKKFDRIHEHVLEDHKAKRESDKNFVPKDIIDVLLQMTDGDHSNLEVNLSRDCVKGLIQNLLSGGTDTSATTVEWVLHEILRQPRTIRNTVEELDRVIGKDRWVEEDDFSKLPYIEAIIMETMRLHPLTTFSAPHYSTEDCNVAGYDIPKGTTVLINTWSIGRDPHHWDAPEEFKPERFLGKKTDISGTNFGLLPFGSGRRRCPGYSLGIKLVRSTLANLLHGFNWKLADENMRAEDVCMDEVYGLTTHPKVPLAMIMEPRLPSHLYANKGFNFS